MKHKYLSLVVVVSLVTALFAFFAPVAGAADPVTITFWKASHGEKDTDWAPIIAAFEAANPDIKVEAVIHPWEGWDERYGSAFAAGNPPDVSYMPDEFYPRFAAAGQLVQMEVAAPDAVAAMAPDFPENLWKLGQYQGHQYGVPYLFVALQLFYNKDLFDAAGLAYPPSSPDDPGFAEWTWEKFAEVAQKLTDPAKDQWGFAWSAAFRDPNYVYPFLWQAGADILDVAANKNAFGNEKGLAGFQMMYDLVHTYKVVPADGMDPKFQQWFFDGKAAMCPVESYSVATLRSDYPDLNVGAALAPQGPGKDFFDGRGTFGNAGFMVIAEASQNKEAAVKFVQFISSKEMNQQMMDVVKLFGARNDFVPPDDPLFQVFMTGKPYLVGYPLHPKLRQVHSLITPEVQAMILDQKTPEQALNDAAAAVDALLAEGAPPAAGPDAAALLQERCTKCHDLARVQAAKKTVDEWKATVERMVGKGAQLDAAEQAALIAYLAATYPK
jgi:multiple sugar transport system substrate-binding protein